MKLRSVLLLLPLCVAAFSLTLPESPLAQTSNWTFCASEGGDCAFSGTTQVRYGANGAYVYQTLTDGTPCTNAVFRRSCSRDREGLRRYDATASVNVGSTG